MFSLVAGKSQLMYSERSTMLLSTGGTQNISSQVATTTLLQAHTTSAVTLTVFFWKQRTLPIMRQLRMTCSCQLIMNFTKKFSNTSLCNDVVIRQNMLHETLSSTQVTCELQWPNQTQIKCQFRAPRSKKWNFRTKFLVNFRTFLWVSRGSRHKKNAHTIYKANGNDECI